MTSLKMAQEVRCQISAPADIPLNFTSTYFLQTIWGIPYVFREVVLLIYVAMALSNVKQRTL